MMAWSTNGSRAIRSNAVTAVQSRIGNIVTLKNPSQQKNLLFFSTTCTFLSSSSTSKKHGVPAETMRNVVHLATNIRSPADVESLLLTYGVKNAHIPSTVRPLAVVKVGGEVISKDLPNLVSSLKFLKDFGLFPVVIHGGGPQLNDELAKAGVKPEYIGGHRVTDPATMSIAKRVFEAANGDLSAALRSAGMPTTSLLGGIFGAEVANPQLGLVGEINRVYADAVNAAISENKIPVLTSLGLSSSGQVLNINADVAARELSIALQPLKVVFISAGGGWKEEGKVVAEVNMAADYERMVNRDYTGRQGTLLKLKEMKQIIDKLPAVSSITIASASALAAQLLPHTGPGTQIRRGQKLHRFHSIGNTDATRLEALFRACGNESAVKLIEANGNNQVSAVFATNDYSAAAIVVTGSTSGGAPALLHSLAVSPIAYAEGVEAALWTTIVETYPSLAWYAAPAVTDIPAAAATIDSAGPSQIPLVFPSLTTSRTSVYASGSSRLGSGASAGSAMWYGVDAAHIPSTIAAVSLSLAPAAVAPITVTSNTNASSGSCSKTNKSASGNKVARVGLLGARGFVGRELLKLIATHPNMSVVCASSRALVGKSVPEGLGVPEAGEACVPNLRFSDVGPEQLKKGDHPEVDAWVLAMPNGLAQAHSDAIDAYVSSSSSSSKVVPLQIDLSADMRFDKTGAWTYGLPERPNAREALKKAKKISNPGCYATGAQAALMPLLAAYRAGSPFAWDPSAKPHVFGVSGYSGAGTSPSDKNDPSRLRDNLLPYALVGHIHEREVGHHCGLPIAFMPHVAPFFQGISLTVTGHLLAPNGGAASITPATIRDAYASFYKGEKLMRVLTDEKAMPDVGKHGSFKHGVTVGGFTYDPKTGRLALVSCIDNLLKGAATQAIQNMNLALGLEEYAGIPLQNA